jgi:hypothetical protein
VQGHRDGGRGVIVRAALQAGEHRLVQRGRVLCGRHDHRTAWTAERLVRRRGDHVDVPGRGRVGPAGDQPGDVRDVGRQHGARFGGDLRESGEVDGTRDRRPAAEEDLRPFAQRQVADLVHVDPAGVGPDGVLHGVEPLAGDRHRPAVGQVAAHRQRHPHDRVAGAGEGQVDGQVGGRARGDLLGTRLQAAGRGPVASGLDGPDGTAETQEGAAGD